MFPFTHDYSCLSLFFLQPHQIHNAIHLVLLNHPLFHAILILHPLPFNFHTYFNLPHHLFPNLPESEINHHFFIQFSQCIFKILFIPESLFLPHKFEKISLSSAELTWHSVQIVKSLRLFTRKLFRDSVGVSFQVHQCPPRRIAFL